MNTKLRDAMADAEKKCSGCGDWKPLKDFYTSRRRDGRVEYYGRCKDCHNKHVARRRRDKIKRDPEYLGRERARVAVYRTVDTNRQRANNRSTANHEALSRLRARYPDEYAAYKAGQLASAGIKRSVALYRATQELRDHHYVEYSALYREALQRKGVT